MTLVTSHEIIHESCIISWVISACTCINNYTLYSQSACRDKGIWSNPFERKEDNGKRTLIILALISLSIYVSNTMLISTCTSLY